MELTPFGKYTLIERLAAGGMGEVFLARGGKRGYERFFAIKRILTQHEDSGRFIEMLKNEARINIGLVHPNIAQVFEFGELEGHFFLAMEFVDGLSLAGALRRGSDQQHRLSSADALYIVRQTAQALDYAHRKVDDHGTPLNLIDRDISPHNILIDEAGMVKLIDFGIARASQNTVKTEEGTLKGKLPYMSPEQASGRPLDPRTDLFSLGAVMFEMLSYRRLYKGSNTMETFNLAQKAIIPPWADALPEAPDPVLRVLSKALAAEPDHRYASAADMEKDAAKALAEISSGYTSHSLAEHLAVIDDGREERKARRRGLLLRVEQEQLEHETTPEVPAHLLLSSPHLDLDHTTSETAFLKEHAPKSQALPVALGMIGVAALLGLAFFVMDGGGPAPLPPPELPTTIPTTPPTEPAAATPATPASSATSGNDASRPTTSIKSRRRGREGRRRARSRPTTPAPKPAPVTPAPVANGCVAVDVEPWAHVLVAGRKRETTPIACLSLPAGSHTLTLSNPALGIEKKVRVRVKAGQTVKVHRVF